MAKRFTIDLPDAAEKATLAVVMWTDSKGRAQLTVEHRDPRIPFTVAREAMVSALALLEPDQDPRFKGLPTRIAVDRLGESGRGLEFLETNETRKKPS